MISIILAGGSGTHLWPLSREKYPKQFLKINNYSLFQQTFIRCLKVSSIDKIFVVIDKDYKYFVMGQIQELGYEFSWDNVLIEPDEKNTLPAICFGMKTIQKRFYEDDLIVGIFPSDLVLDIEEMKTINDAVSIASKNLFVLFGIKPKAPQTGYGYVKAKGKIDIGKKVVEFKEKPNQEDAKKYIENGFFWNSGILLVNISTFFEEIKKYSSEIFQIFMENDDVKTIYDKISSISIDYEILEKSQKLTMVQIKGSWSDLDDFSDLYNYLKKDLNGNVVHHGDFSSIDSHNNLIYSTVDKLISLVDVDNMIIVDSSDVLLVAPKNKSQQVKQIVEHLKNNGDKRVLLGQTVYRPWGWYTVLEGDENHMIKKICVLPQHTLSLQMHYHRSEHWVVVSGIARVHVEGNDFFVQPGESTFINNGEKHRLANPSDSVKLEIIEVQLGEYIDEEDIVRFEDVYGRA